jgi:malate dehydrogenase
MTSGELGISDAVVGLPCVIGRNGIIKVADLNLSDAEISQIQATAKKIKASLNIG